MAVETLERQTGPVDLVLYGPRRLGEVLQWPGMVGAFGGLALGLAIAMLAAPRLEGRRRVGIFLVLLLAFAVAGLAGAIEVAGRTGYVTLDMSPGYGYAGIVIAMLAGLNPLGVVAAAVFVAGVLVGADSMSRAVDVPTYIADVIVAVALLSMLAATVAARYRLRLR